MNYLSRILWTAVALFPLGLFADPPAPATPEPASEIPPLSPTQWAELRKGDTILLAHANDDDPRSILGAILINAPRESAWHVVNDKEKGPEFTKGLLRAKILERGDSYMLVEQDMKVGVIPGTFTYVMRHEMIPPQRVNFERLRGDLKEVKGYWKFAPVDENTKTLLIYSLYIDPGFFLPRSIMERSMKKKVPEALHEIKDRTELIHPTLTAEEKATTQPLAAPQAPLKPATLRPTILSQ